ncbi:MAG: MotA/TolQ/ExbB proton channel family protein [Myxococcales bacterium]|nr:MotA/TolQ/ExbB proton channel family protein [Myxococcales bacterium]
MNNHVIVEQVAQGLDQLGAAWVLYLLIGLSVMSVAVVVERLLFLRRNHVPVGVLQGRLLVALDEGRDAAVKLLRGYTGMEAVVALAGVEQLHRGSAAAEEIMASAEAVERQRYSRFTGFLGSLGSNAPFVGLLGTVIGIMGAFADLQAAGGGGARTQLIMGSISEALVATAVGLLVAIPAVVAYNQLRGRIESVEANTQVLSGIVLAHLKQVDVLPRQAQAATDTPSTNNPTAARAARQVALVASAG